MFMAYAMAVTMTSLLPSMRRRPRKTHRRIVVTDDGSVLSEDWKERLTGELMVLLMVVTEEIWCIIRREQMVLRLLLIKMMMFCLHYNEDCCRSPMGS